MKKEINTNKIMVSKKVFVFVSFLLLIFIGRICYLCLVDYSVNDTTISAFIENRNIKEETIEPVRGSIFDKNGNILAQEVASYTVIAYLDETRSENSKTLNHVEDIEGTAKTLAPYINMDEGTLINLLSKEAYQVELGPGGRNLSQIQMEEIKNLNLPGIDFIKSSKRYYPNGDFASYMIGYTVNKTDEEGETTTVGELGIEEYFNDELTGTEGYIAYEKDRYGYKIANGREYVEEADDGNDIYLTIDNNIQLFIENAVKNAQNESEAEWVLMAVMDAKTGAILGYSSTPSFDPNLRNMTSYLDPIISSAYEPGSTMKIFSYMCAVESGKYDGDSTFESGSKTYESEIDNDNVTISDWNKKGWGTITYDQGFALSSNIGVANLLETTITKKELKACYEDYGFGEKTYFYEYKDDKAEYKKEYSGSIEFKYDIEAATAGYGQGITTTPIQHLQALSILTNNGDMLKPYIVDKIVDNDTGKIVYQAETIKEENVVSETSVNKMIELLRSVVQPDSKTATGYPYYMEGYDLIGKTGTAQIFDYQSNKYMSGESDYIYSFSGIYPGDNPEIIIYTALKRPKDTTNYISKMVKEVVVNTSKYLNIEEDSKEYKSFNIDNYINKDTKFVTDILKLNDIKVMTLGTGNKIINQYPSVGSIINNNELVILLTNEYTKTMPNLVGMSFKEVITILDFLNINYEYEGYGYLESQSIEENVAITNEKVKLFFKPKYGGDTDE